MKENIQSPQPFDSAQGKPTSEIPEYSPPPPSGPSKLLIILGGVVILILGIAGGWYYGRSSKPAENIQAQAPTPSVAQSDDMEGWETYVSETRGFSFQYPTSFTLNAANPQWLILTPPSDDWDISVQTSEVIEPIELSDIEEDATMVDLIKEEVIIAGVPSIRVEYYAVIENVKNRFKTVRYILNDEKGRINIIFFPTIGLIEQESFENSMEQLQQIISTFKFVE